MIGSVVRPLKPRNLSSWYRGEVSGRVRGEAAAVERWIHKQELFSVLSAVEVVAEGPGKEPRPEYHVSIARLRLHHLGKPEVLRVDSATALEVLRMFECEGFLEDNHVPGGLVRNFWRPVAGNYVGQVCQCQETEPTMREDKGDYIWRG